MIATATRAMLVLAALATAGVLVRAADVASLSSLVFLLGIAAWGVLPYAALLWSLARRPAHPWRARIVAGIALPVVGAAAWSIWRGFITSSDGQAALLFLFLPPYQLLAIAVVLGSAEWWMRGPGAGVGGARPGR
ncbi:MAG: hypothetical protein MUE41_16550 [Gemmatimonadaceae bacterium]|nr:hypothetical protein [Gemmatimonadaceae bacterium]